MTREDRQRKLVSRLIMANFAGIVLTGPYIGHLVKEGRDPWLSIAAALLMFLGIVVPLYRLFNRMRDDFDDVQAEALRTLRRSDGRTGGQEVFANQPPTPKFRNAASQPLVAVLITAAAWALLATDLVRYLFL